MKKSLRRKCYKRADFSLPNFCFLCSAFSHSCLALFLFWIFLRFVTSQEDSSPSSDMNMKALFRLFSRDLHQSFRRVGTRKSSSLKHRKMKCEAGVTVGGENLFSSISSQRHLASVKLFTTNSDGCVDVGNWEEGRLININQLSSKRLRCWKFPRRVLFYLN